MLLQCGNLFFHNFRLFFFLTFRLFLPEATKKGGGPGEEQGNLTGVRQPDSKERGRHAPGQGS